MKRGLVFSLCALALVVSSTTTQAQNVQVSLNLRYTDPADPTEGGTWTLVAKTDDTDGIAAISAYLSNINLAGIVYGNGAGPGSDKYTATTAAQLGAILNGGNPFAGTFGGAANVVYGQDIAGGPIVADVGQGAGTPGNNALGDPLKNATWNNAATIASGTFGATRPAFAVAGANSTDANTLAGTTLGVAAQDAVTTTTVRGDSLISFGLNTPGTTGLLPGDANRDFAVNGLDLAVLAANFNGTGKVWDQGDFNDSANGAVDGLDLAALAANFNQTSPSPTVSSVPEPSTIALAVLAIGGIVAARRRS